MTEKAVPRTDDLVLSPTPIPLSARRVLESESLSTVRFADLAALRVHGIGGAVRALRALRPSRVLVTGEETELQAFRDILILMAQAVPGARRFHGPLGRSHVPLRLREILGSSMNLLAGAAKGYTAFLRSLLRLASIGRSPRAIDLGGGRVENVMYLKPALTFGPQVGGSVGHVAGVVNALHRQGQKVRLLTLRSQPLADPGVEQVTIPPPRMTAYPHELNRFRYNLIFLEQALREAADFRPDYIYQRYCLDDFTGIFLRMRMRIPLILEFNGSETWAQKHWGQPLRFHRVSEHIERTNLRHADLVVVVSEEIRRQVCRRGVPEDRVLFYPNCIDPALFDPSRFDVPRLRLIRSELGVPTDADLFTFVGSFGRWHGADLLALAIRRLIDQDRSFLEAHRIHFLLVGDGHYAARVRSVLGEDLGAPFVTLTGYKPQGETPGILAASNVCLSPHVPNPDGSPFFGSPTKLFEYMAMAKLIVASDLDQIGWVLRGWSPGTPPPRDLPSTSAAAILTDPGNLDSLVNSIRLAAVMDRETRDRLGGLARDFVLRSFTWGKNVETVLAAFACICGPKGSPVRTLALEGNPKS